MTVKCSPTFLNSIYTYLALACHQIKEENCIRKQINILICPPIFSTNTRGRYSLTIKTHSHITRGSKKVHAGNTVICLSSFSQNYELTSVKVKLERPSIIIYRLLRKKIQIPYILHRMRKERQEEEHKIVRHNISVIKCNEFKSSHRDKREGKQNSILTAAEIISTR